VWPGWHLDRWWWGRRWCSYSVAGGSGVGAGSGVSVGVVHGVESGGGVFGWCWLERVFMLVFMKG